MNVKLAFENRNFTKPFFRSLKSKSQTEMNKNKQQNVEKTTLNQSNNKSNAFNRQANGYCSFRGGQPDLINTQHQKDQKFKTRPFLNQQNNESRPINGKLNSNKETLLENIPNQSNIPTATLILDTEPKIIIHQDKQNQKQHEEVILEFPSVITYIVEEQHHDHHLCDDGLEVGEVILNYDNSSSSVSYSANDWDTLNESQRRNDDIIDSLKKQIEFLNKQLADASSKDDTSIIKELSDKIEQLAKLNYVI
jgi:hypothetical protein